MRERIQALAQALAGPANETLAETLSGAAEALWRGRLKEDVTEADCGEALLCAAAFTVAADLLAGGGGIAAFTAGDLSVKGPSGGERLASAQALREAAERLMAPYALPGDICLKGVGG